MPNFAHNRSAATLHPIRHRCRPMPGRLALTVVGALSACAAPGTDKDHVNWLGQDEHRIVVTATAFSEAEAVRVGFTDRWQTEEYALLKAGGRQLELVFAEARKDFTVALDYQMPITSMVPTWNANARHEPIWGTLGRFDWRPGTWFYRVYRSGELQRPCVGLQVEWDEIGQDPNNRPRRVLFGYACGVAGEALDDEDARALIRGIAIRRRNPSSAWRSTTQREPEGAPAPALPDAGVRASSAITAARGQGPFPESGNPRFPFAFARYYSESNSGTRP